MKIVVDFLSQLRLNNNREWFGENRELYEEALSRFNKFTIELQGAISLFDPSVMGLKLNDMTYRIYHDMRFHPNREPYKTHMGAYVARGGKKSGYAGYYIHIEPSNNGSLMGAGIYNPVREILTSVRDEIYDNGDEFVAAMERAKGFELDRSDSLIRMPRGFQEGHKYDELLKLKRFLLGKPISNESILQPNLLERVASEFSTTSEFVEIINRAVQFAHEEM